MKCTECKSETIVRKTKAVNEALTRRHRRCPICSETLTTLELPAHLARFNQSMPTSAFTRIRKKVQELIDTLDFHDPANAP